jgi:acyl carrier protein
MKIKLSLLNISYIIFLVGLFSTIGIGMKSGAILVLGASAIIIATYILQIIHSIRQNRLWTLDNLLYTFAITVFAIVFIHGFSVSISMPFLGNVPVFNSIYLLAGIVLIILFFTGSIRSIRQLNRGKQQYLLIVIYTIVSIASVMGLLGIAGIFPVSGRLIFYAWVFLIIFFEIFFIVLLFQRSKQNSYEIWILIILTGLMILFSIVRFNFPELLPQGLTKSIIYFGFVPVILLPLGIALIKKYQFFTVFILYFILLDFYFIHTDRNFNYLIKAGLNECIGYEDADDFQVNYNPGIDMDELLQEPTESEINNILQEWSEKDFKPERIQIEYTEELPNGDSIKIVSHLVNDKKHYGFIRIPKSINIQAAPILMGLIGGGTGIDVLKIEDITGGKCSSIRNNYISIMPSFRGNLLRLENLCFRSEGYAGDVWLGAAEDAVAFLEVVKSLYNKSDTTKVLASGVSRGATVALIIGGLTDKVDYIIASSTHTKFLDYSVIQNEQVGRSYPAAFYTPEASPEEVRKRIVASSPYYFADRFPPFELHQGTEDQKTTVWHARRLEERLKEIDSDENTYRIYIYENKGHGYDDDDIVCQSLSKFLSKTN